VVQLHGIPVSIVSDRDPRFTFQLWPSIQHALGTRLDMGTTFHPQIDGQLKRVIQVLEYPITGMCARIWKLGGTNNIGGVHV